VGTPQFSETSSVVVGGNPMKFYEQKFFRGFIYLAIALLPVLALLIPESGPASVKERVATKKQNQKIFYSKSKMRTLSDQFESKDPKIAQATHPSGEVR